MQRDGQSEQARVEKKKADYAEKCLPIFEIDFSSRRDEGATIFGSTTKLSMARYRQLAVRNGLTPTRYPVIRALPLQNQCSNFSRAASGLAPSEVAMA